VGAIAIGETLEAATVVFLFAVGEALEGYTADRARDSLRGLMELAPGMAVRLVLKVPSSEFRVPSENEKEGLRTKDLGLREEAASYQLPVSRAEVPSSEFRVPSEKIEENPGYQIPIGNVGRMPVFTEEVVPVEALRVGDVILVKPGE